MQILAVVILLLFHVQSVQLVSYAVTGPPGVVVGQSASLTCTLSDIGVPDTSAIWKRKGFTIATQLYVSGSCGLSGASPFYTYTCDENNNGSRYDLRIDSLTTSENGATWTCGVTTTSPAFSFTFLNGSSLGENCIISEQCVTNTECISGTCQCSNGYFQAPTGCFSIIILIVIIAVVILYVAGCILALYQTNRVEYEGYIIQIGLSCLGTIIAVMIYTICLKRALSKLRKAHENKYKGAVKSALGSQVFGIQKKKNVDFCADRLVKEDTLSIDIINEVKADSNTEVQRLKMAMSDWHDADDEGELTKTRDKAKETMKHLYFSSVNDVCIERYIIELNKMQRKKFGFHREDVQSAILLCNGLHETQEAVKEIKEINKLQVALEKLRQYLKYIVISNINYYMAELHEMNKRKMSIHNKVQGLIELCNGLQKLQGAVEKKQREILGQFLAKFIPDDVVKELQKMQQEMLDLHQEEVEEVIELCNGLQKVQRDVLHMDQDKRRKKLDKYLKKNLLSNIRHMTERNQMNGRQLSSHSQVQGLIELCIGLQNVPGAVEKEQRAILDQYLTKFIPDDIVKELQEKEKVKLDYHKEDVEGVISLCNGLQKVHRDVSQLDSEMDPAELAQHVTYIVPSIIKHKTELKQIHKVTLAFHREEVQEIILLCNGLQKVQESIEERDLFEAALMILHQYLKDIDQSNIEHYMAVLSKEKKTLSIDVINGVVGHCNTEVQNLKQAVKDWNENGAEDGRKTARDKARDALNALTFRSIEAISINRYMRELKKMQRLFRQGIQGVISLCNGLQKVQEAVQKNDRELKAALEAIRPYFTNFVPNYIEHYMAELHKVSPKAHFLREEVQKAISVCNERQPKEKTKHEVGKPGQGQSEDSKIQQFQPHLHRKEVHQAIEVCNVTTELKAERGAGKTKSHSFDLSDRDHDSIEAHMADIDQIQRYQPQLHIKEVQQDIAVLNVTTELKAERGAGKTKSHSIELRDRDHDSFEAHMADIHKGRPHRNQVSHSDDEMQITPL